MLRRKHKKSWGGCLQCKQRHIKCDKARPVCLLCTMSGRDCSFASQGPPNPLSTSSNNQPVSSDDNRGQDGALQRNIDSLYISNMAGYPNDNNHMNPDFDQAINLSHMELVIHLTSDETMFNLGNGIGDFSSNMSLALRTGLKSPYLLYQLLAFSARHLAFLNLECSASYLHQAVALQTRAVSLFNSSLIKVDESNCTAVLLFSSVLGHHLLADMLTKRDHGGLEPFMAHYVQCVEMHRGIYTIALTAWPLLMESELQQILSWSSGFTSQPSKGNDCQRIRELVNGADDMKKEDKEACQQAIQYLQVGFDTVLAEEEQGNRYQMIFLWTMLVPPEFASLLNAKRPEALVLLGYYALLLHYGRCMWQVGDAGTYILGIVIEHLGPEWDYWLEYPRERVLQPPNKETNFRISPPYQESNI